MIAISYRREDSLPIAGRLYDRLQTEFGKRNVFMDFDSIPPGVDFRERIKETIEKSDLVIALIGPHWLGEQSDGSRRIDDPTDFVRLEIEYALKRKIPVIPLLINSTQMPKPDKLPSDIEALAFRNALPLDSGLDFHQHVDRLIGGLGDLTDRTKIQSLRVGNRSRVPLKTSDARQIPDRRKLVAGLIVVALVAIGACAWLFIDGRNRISYKPAQQAREEINPTNVSSPPEASATSAPSPRLETSRPSRPSFPVADSVARTSKEIAECDQYRATANDVGGDVAPSWKIWIMQRRDDGLVATIPAGFLPVSTGVFSADGNYFVYEVGSASAGTRMSLARIKEEGGVDDINLTLDETAPPKLLQARLGLPAGGGFDHSYCTPVSVSTEPLALNFDFYVDRYSSENRPSIQINKATRFAYRVDTHTLEITGPLPKLPSSVAAASSPTATPATKKLFAGTWDGMQNSFDGRTGKPLPGFKNKITVNQAETEVNMGGGGGLLKGWHKTNAHTLSLTMGSGKAGRHDLIVVSADGKTATYTMELMGHMLYRGTFHRSN